MHSFLNPFKGVGPVPLVTNQQGSDQEIIGAKNANKDKTRPIIDTDKSEKDLSETQTTKDIQSEKGDLVLKPEIKAEIAEDNFDSSIFIHSCGVCCKTFDNLPNLESHMEIHMRKSEDTRACEECGESFRKAYKNCQQHQKFSCSGCGKEFREAHKSCSYHNRRRKGEIPASSCFLS